jgi:hypothetical protein
MVVDAAMIDQFWSTSTLRQRFTMSTFDEITKEKQRIGEALARVDAQHDKLATQLGELEATERVMALQQRCPGQKDGFSQGVRNGKGNNSSAVPCPTAQDGRKTIRWHGNLDEPCLGKRQNQQEIAAACQGVRANHVGIAIARHKRAGRIEERDGKLYATPSTEQTQPAAV